MGDIGKMQKNIKNLEKIKAERYQGLTKVIKVRVLLTLFLLVFSLSLVSANIFGDFWNWVNGNKDIQTDKSNEMLSSSGVSGISLKEFKVNDVSTTNLKNDFTDVNLETTYKNIGKGTIKQDIILTNKKGISTRYNYSSIIEIDYGTIRWNGKDYVLKDIPVKLDSVIVKDIGEVYPNIFMGVENKRINYRDIGLKGGYVLAYSKEGKYYIEMRIDNLLLKGNEEYVIDPTYSNGTSGFSVASAGLSNPVGVTTNGTDIWVSDNTDNWIYHFKNGANQTDGFKNSYQVNPGAPSLFAIDLKNSTAMWTMFGDGVVEGINLQVLGTGANITGNFIDLDELSNGGNTITSNNTDMWTSDSGDRWVNHFKNTNPDGFWNKSLNQTDGFSMDIMDSPYGLALYKNKEFYSYDRTENFIYHFNDGINQTDGFDVSAFGITAGRDMDYDSTNRIIWIVDNADMFVYQLVAGVEVTLNSPVTEYNTTSSISLNCTAEGTDLQNISLFNNITGTWHRNQTVDLSITDPEMYEKVFYIDSMPLGKYNWTCEAGQLNGQTLLASENRTFTVKINHSIYDIPDPVTIDNKVNYSIIINYTAIPLTTAYLILNNTQYDATTTTHTANQYIFNVSIIIPDTWGNITGINIPYYWNYTLNGIVNNESSNIGTTKIYSLIPEDCAIASGDIILNLTIKDEEQNIILNGATNNTIIELDLTITSKTNISNTYNFSKTWNDNSSVAVCLPAGIINYSSYRIDFTASYQADDYVKEFYYLDNGTLDNSTLFNPYTTKEITLYDLLTADSTTFLFKFTDENGVSVKDAIVHTFRKYIGDGIYREVERSREDNNGETHMHLVEEDVIYYFKVSKNGLIIYTSSEYNAKCISTPCQISLTASSADVIIDDEWDLSNNTDYYIIANTTSRQVQLIFSSSVITNMNITMYKFNNNALTYVNSTNLTATSGTLTLTAPNSYGNTTFYIDVYENDIFLRNYYLDFRLKAIDYFGTSGAIFAGIMVLALILMAVTEGIGFIVFTLLGVLTMGILQLIDLSWLAFMSLVCAGGIIIWKLVKRRNV